MKQSRLCGMVVCMVLCVGISGALADQVILKSGKVLNGTIIEETDQYIRIDYEGMPLYFQKKLIAEIKDRQLPAQREPVEKPQSAGVPLSKTDTALLDGLRACADGKMGEARKLLTKGLGYNPGNVNIAGALATLDAVDQGTLSREYAQYLFKGSYYLLLEEYREAANWLENARVLQPDDLDVLYNLGVAYYSLKDFKTSIVYLRDVVERAPQDAYAYSLLGHAYYMIGDEKKAKESMLRAQLLFSQAGQSETAEDVGHMLKELSLDGE